jgi:acetylornithine deacetylase/succinyl-diaminopimelate desuccinylase-like protein
MKALCMGHDIEQHVSANFYEYVDELISLIRKPSVSATGQGVLDCASHLAERMGSFGIEPRVHELSDGPPVLVADVAGKNPDRVLLVYDHYDVQPPDPLDEWKGDPFSGEVSDGKIHGRGATDSKGNLMAYLSAVRALQETVGLPMSVRFMFEGEEEISSPHLEGFVDSHAAELAADAVVCCDGDMDPSGRPLVSLGMKGLVYVQLRCKKTKTDLHSSKAALLPSAAWRLVKALDTIRDDEGRVAIAGWEEGKLEPGEEDVRLMESIPFDEEEIKEGYGVSEFVGGRHGLEALEGYLYDPTCNIAGLTSGYQGEGVKTVMPAEATAKMDFRIVYDQRADRCLQLIKEHLRSKGFPDVEVVLLGSSEPSHTPSNAPVARAAMEAARTVYGRDPVVYPKHYASGPDHLFTNNLSLHSIWTGCAPAHGGGHAPNEFIGLEDYRLGILYACELICRFAGG